MRHNCLGLTTLAMIAALNLLVPSSVAAERQRTDLPADPPLPPARPVELPASSAKEVSASQPSSADAEGCLDRLAATGARFEKLDAIEDGACGAAEPIRLLSLPAGIEVSPPATMTCPLAEALSRWSIEGIRPAAMAAFSQKPSAILIGTSYQCREQRSGGKPSEHALANAVDVMGFKFASEDPVPIAIHPENAPEAAFQSAIRQSACDFFTTVLGPGSDEDHADHLHLDLRGRRGGYRICQ